MSESLSSDKIVDRVDHWTMTAMRFACAIGATTAIVLLIVAGTLEPSRSGMGTHHQLGLPPCSLRMLAGIRCPSCGMTTSWAHFMNGNLIASAKSNLGGMMLAFFAIASIFVGARIAWTGRLPNFTTQRNYTLTLVGIAAVTLADWAIRLWFRH